MTETDDEQATRRTMLARGIHAARSLGRGIWAAIAAVVIAAALFISFGGLGPATASPVELGASEEARTPLYSVAALDAVTAGAVEEEYFEAEPGDTLVLVTLRLENLSDRPVGFTTSTDRIEARFVNAAEPLLALTDVEPTDSARAWRTDGSAGGIVLQPGVPVEVQVGWPVPEDAFADGILRLDVHEPVVTAGKVILSSDRVTWLRGDLTARITVPVRALESTS